MPLPTSRPDQSPENVDATEAIKAAVAQNIPVLPKAAAPATPPPSSGVEFYRASPPPTVAQKIEVLSHPFTLFCHPDQWELVKLGDGYMVLPRVSRLAHEAGVANVDTAVVRDAAGKIKQYADPAMAIAGRERMGYRKIAEDHGMPAGQTYVLVHRDPDTGVIRGYSDPWTRPGIGGRSVRDQAAYVTWVLSLIGTYVPRPSTDHLQQLQMQINQRLAIYTAGGKHPQHTEILKNQLMTLTKMLEQG